MKKRACVICGADTRGGYASLEDSSFWTFLFVGVSHVKLFFCPKGRREEEFALLEQGRKVESFRCDRCGTLNMTNTLWVG